MTEILDKLRGGDRCSIGRSEEVVADVVRDPPLFDALVAGMLDADPLVRMRSADAVEKATRERPAWLVAHRRLILDRIDTIDRQEVHWHVAQMIPRPGLSEADVPDVRVIFEDYLADRSRIVQVEAMHALAYLAELSPALR